MVPGVAPRGDLGNNEHELRCGLRHLADLIDPEQDEAQESGGLRVSLDEGAFPPVRAHDADAGIDLRAMEGDVVPAHGSAVIRTGTHVEVPRGFAGLLVSRSGLNVRRGVTTTGLVDSGYTGEVLVRMHNDSDRDYLVGPGDRVTQLVVIPCMLGPVTVVDSIGGGERGDAGFGSTGR